MRARLRSVVNSDLFQHLILGLIFMNGVVLAWDAMPGVSEETRRILQLSDRIIVWVFIVEIALRIVANGRAFFRDGWSLFDFFVVAVSAPGTVTGLSALRILRALRLLRVLSGVSQLRRVGEALLAAVPGISWVMVLLVLIIFISAIIGTNLYAETVPEYFGDLLVSMYTLFMVLTLEDWPDVAGAVLEHHPMGWIYFVAFITVATFTVVNLFVGVIVAVMDRETSDYYDWEKAYRAEMRDQIVDLQAKLRAISGKLDHLASGATENGDAGGDGDEGSGSAPKRAGEDEPPDHLDPGP
jgi:voltage-gated sodium channel